MLECPIQSRGLAIQRDGFVRFVIVGRAMHLQGYMVPRVALGMARNARRYPMRVLAIPDSPLIAGGDAALVAEDQAHPVKELVDVEFQGFRESQIVPVEIHVVSEIVQAAGHRAIAVGHPLRGQRTDEVVVPQRVRVGRGSSDVEYGCGTAL